MAIEEVLVLEDRVSETAEKASEATKAFAQAQKAAQQATQGVAKAQGRLAAEVGRGGANAAVVAKLTNEYRQAKAAAESASDGVTKAQRAINRTALAASKAKGALKDHLEKPMRDAAKAAAKLAREQEKIAKATAKTTVQVRRQERSLTRNTRGMADFGEAGQSALGPLLAPFGEFSTSLEKLGPIAISAALAIAGIGVAGAGVLKLAKFTLQAAGEAEIARGNFKRMLDQATAGRGAEALAHLDELAERLNMSVGDATKSFIDLRKKGLNNVQSSQVIKLRADLKAVGVESGIAEKAIEKTIEAIKEGKPASAAIKETAKAFGAVGDGSDAAAKKAFTLEGAVKNAKLSLERFWASVSKQVGPALTSAGKAFTDFIKSAEGSKTIESVIDGIEAAAKAIPPLLKAMTAAGKGFIKAVGPGIRSIKDSFSALDQSLGGAKGSLDAAKIAGAAFGAVVSAIGFVVSTFVNSVAGAVTVVKGWHKATVEAGEAISNAIKAIGDIDLGELAADLVAGFIKGLKDKVATVTEAAKSLGTAAKDAIAWALEIDSPSKVAQEMGANVGNSFADSLESTMPIELPTPTGPAANGNAGFAGRGGSGAPGGASVSVTVNVTQANASVEDIEAATMRGVESGLRMAGVA